MLTAAASIRASERPRRCRGLSGGVRLRKPLSAFRASQLVEDERRVMPADFECFPARVPSGTQVVGVEDAFSSVGFPVVPRVHIVRGAERVYMATGRMRSGGSPEQDERCSDEHDRFCAHRLE